jgi:Na+/H+-dicarboxylate symporter
LLGRTIGLAYGSTLAAGLLAFLVAVSILPHVVPAAATAAAAEESALQPWLSFRLTPLLSVITALIAAFIFGLGINATRSATLAAVFDEGRAIIDRLLARVIIPLLPVYIAGVFSGMAADGRVATTLQTFGLVLLVAVVLHWVWLSVLYLAAGLRKRRSPLTLLRGMLPAYVTALGTMSSAATIPVTLRSIKSLGVRPAVADFVAPLCANIHLSGSTITLVSCATAVAALSPDLGLPGLGVMLPFILVLGIVMVAAPGAPGGAVMAALGLLSAMLGFNESHLALMIALYMAQDSFGTATNVTGDGAIALLVEPAEASESV